MSLAPVLRVVLDDAAAALRSQGIEDTATMMEEAAGILAGHLEGAADVAEDAAVRLVDHLFRGSAAAGAIQSMPPVAEAPAPEPAPEPVPEPEPEPVAEPAPEPAAAETPVPSIDLGVVGEPPAPVGWAPPPDPPAAV